MASKAQALKEIERLGFEIDPETECAADLGFQVVLDAKGRTAIGADCRGIACVGMTASSLWDAVISEARFYAPYLEPCPHPIGQCDFHDEA